MTLSELLDRGQGQIVKWHRKDGETWDMTAIANGGILGNPHRVIMVKVGTFAQGEGMYVTDIDNLSIPPADEPQFDDTYFQRGGVRT